MHNGSNVCGGGGLFHHDVSQQTGFNVLYEWCIMLVSFCVFCEDKECVTVCTSIPNCRFENLNPLYLSYGLVKPAACNFLALLGILRPQHQISWSASECVGAARCVFGHACVYLLFVWKLQVFECS